MTTLKISVRKLMTSVDGNTQKVVTKKYLPSWFQPHVFEAIFPGTIYDPVVGTLTFQDVNISKDDIIAFCWAEDGERLYYLEERYEKQCQTIFTRDEEEVANYFEGWNIENIVDEFRDLLRTFLGYEPNGNFYDRTAGRTYFIFKKEDLELFEVL